MIKYLQKIIDDFPEVICSTDMQILSEDQVENFHQTVAQFLFLCMKPRMDIQTLIAFLTMRFRFTGVDEWGKLKWGMNYLKGTLYRNLYLRADYINMIHWWVDVSYSTHWDFKSHTRAVMSMGAGAILSFSRKQKLNTGSSTEVELVGIADALGMMMWTTYFMEAQVYSIYNNIRFQDNHYTILLAKNSSRLAGNNSKHI